MLTMFAKQKKIKTIVWAITVFKVACAHYPSWRSRMEENGLAWPAASVELTSRLCFKALI